MALNKAYGGFDAKETYLSPYLLIKEGLTNVDWGLFLPIPKSFLESYYSKSFFVGGYFKN